MNDCEAMGIVLGDHVQDENHNPERICKCAGAVLEKSFRGTSVRLSEVSLGGYALLRSIVCLPEPMLAQLNTLLCSRI